MPPTDLSTTEPGGCPSLPLAQRRSRRAYPLVAGLLFAALLSGCSSTTFFYNRLDIVLPWYLERYVDLDRQQAAQFDTQLEGLLDWHRREELPRYVTLIAAMEAELDAELDFAVIEHYTREFEEAWYRVRDRALAELFELGATLSDEQIDEFLAAMEKKQHKYERKYLHRDDDDYHDDAYDELRELHEDYLGRLDAVQRDRLRQAADRLQRSDATWLRERADWLAVVARELEREPGWARRIQRIVSEWEAQLDFATQRVYQHNTRTVQAAMVDVINLRSEKQDARLRRKLAGFREDFLLLAGQADESP